jgi:hypothetical protein
MPSAPRTPPEGDSGTMKRLSLLGAFASLALAMLAAPAYAQQSSGNSQPDLVPVMLWTFVAALFVAGVLALGYLYRRARGAQDEVIPRTVDPYYRQEGHAEEHSTVELHPEMAHDAVGIHADQPAQSGAAGRELTAPDPSGRATREATELAPSEPGASSHSDQR